jgi:hypothetical protein
MKNLKLLIIFVIIIAVSCSLCFLSLSGVLNAGEKDSKIDNLPDDSKQTYNVNISDFRFTSDWGTPSGVMAWVSFNVTLQNLGETDLSDLVLEVTMSDVNGSKIGDAYFYGPGIIGYTAEFDPFDGLLHAGEVRTIQGVIMSDWNTVINAPRPLTTIATVKLGNETLDEWKFTA